MTLTGAPAATEQLSSAELAAFDCENSASVAEFGTFWKNEVSDGNPKSDEVSAENPESPATSESATTSSEELFFFIPSELTDLKKVLQKASADPSLSKEFSQEYRFLWMYGAATVQRPDLIVTNLQHLVKYVDEENEEIFWKIIARIVEAKPLLVLLASVLPKIVDNAPFDLGNKALDVFENLVNSVDLTATSLTESLADLYNALRCEDDCRRLVELTRKLYTSLFPLPWRLRGVIIFQLIKLTRSVTNVWDAIRFFEFGMWSIGIESNASNRTKTESLLCFALVRISEQRPFYTARLSSKLIVDLGSSTRSRHRLSFACICHKLLVDEMISDERFDNLFGDFFFFYFPHDQTPNVRGKFVSAFDRPMKEKLFDVPHKEGILRRILRPLAEIDESETVRVSAKRVLRQFASQELQVKVVKPAEPATEYFEWKGPQFSAAESSDASANKPMDLVPEFENDFGNSFFKYDGDNSFLGVNFLLENSKPWFSADGSPDSFENPIDIDETMTEPLGGARRFGTVGLRQTSDDEVVDIMDQFEKMRVSVPDEECEMDLNTSFIDFDDLLARTSSDAWIPDETDLLSFMIDSNEADVEPEDNFDPEDLTGEKFESSEDGSDEEY